MKKRNFETLKVQKLTRKQQILKIEKSYSLQISTKKLSKVVSQNKILHSKNSIFGKNDSDNKFQNKESQENSNVTDKADN